MVSLFTYRTSWRLDPLTVADDNQYFQTLHRQPNLTDGLAQAIENLYFGS